MKVQLIINKKTTNDLYTLRVQRWGREEDYLLIITNKKTKRELATLVWEKESDETPSFSGIKAFLAIFNFELMEELKEGDEVLVSDNGSSFDSKRVFAKYGENGKYHCYTDGKTKWTSNGLITKWDKCRKAN